MNTRLRRSARALRLLVALVRPRSGASARRRVRRALGVRLLGATPVAPPRPGRPARVPAVAPGYVAGFTRLAAAVLGQAVSADRETFDGPLAAEYNRAARIHRGQSLLADSLSRGESLERGTYRAIERLTAFKDWNGAWALAEGVGRVSGGGRAGALGHALIRHRRRQLDRVWDAVAWLADDELAEHAPIEAVDGALAVGSAATRQRAVAIAQHRERFDATTLVDLAGRFLAFGDTPTAAGLIEQLQHRPADEIDAMDERRQRSRQLIETWLAPEPKAVPDGAVPVAVVDYQTPDQVLASGNLGDYIQTLSLLGNLVRLGGVEFTGEQGLGELARELQGRVRPEVRADGVGGRVHLLDVNRELTSADEIPAGTWMVAFGWHMHPMYDLRYDFPYHPNIRPIFISFHVNRLDMLTDEALDYLRRYGPVGCRDWTTVDLLLSAGVDAFFTGCLTTTVDALFPPRATVHEGGEVAVIDLPRAAAGPGVKGVRTYTHQSDEYRHMSITDGVRAASDVLAGYQRDVDRVVTRRLHAYLPLVALGVPVDFQPWSPGDVRFPGLVGFTPDAPALRAVQDGIRDLIAATFARVLDGASEDDVYAYWRELTAGRLAAARERFAAPVEDPVTTIDVARAVAASRGESRRAGPHEDVDPANVTDIVLCFDQNLTAQAPVLIESVLANASGPVRLSVLGRGLSGEYVDWLAAAFPDLPISYFPCDHVDYGDIGRIPDRITVSTMDRLLLPHLLADIGRVVYLDIDTLVLGDICELGRLDLEGHPIAARDSNISESSEWRGAARRSPEPVAAELIRRMAHDHGWGRPALNAGVLVLDLDRLRRDDFTATYLGWVERYGLHDQDIMLAYANADRAALDPRWNALPVLEDIDDAALIHWASIGKPWDEPLTFAQGQWRAVAGRLHERVGPPPTVQA